MDTKEQKYRNDERKEILKLVNKEIEKVHKANMEDYQIYHLNGMLHIKNMIQELVK